MHYYTSDFHLGHPLLAELRNFDTTFEHDEAIYSYWEDNISEDDTVWVLGDVTLGPFEKYSDRLRELPGTKYLVLGNHDRAFPYHKNWIKKIPAYYEVFDFVGTQATVRSNGQLVMLSHFPYSASTRGYLKYAEWRLRKEGYFLLHGHTHSNEAFEESDSMHVGWDAWGRFVSHGEVDETVLKWLKARESTSA